MVFQGYLCSWGLGQEAQLACYLLPHPESAGSVALAAEAAAEKPPLPSSHQGGEGRAALPPLSVLSKGSKLHLSQTSETDWLEGATTAGQGTGTTLNLLFPSSLNLGDDRSTFPSQQSLGVSSDIYVTGKAYNMYTVV